MKPFLTEGYGMLADCFRSKQLVAVLFAFLALLVPVMEATRLAAPMHAGSRIAQYGPGTTPDFTIVLGTSVLAIPVGSSGSTGITVSSIGSFSGLVLLSTASYALDVSLDKQNVTLLSGGSASATLSVVVPNTATPGNYTLSLNGVNGCSLFHSKDLTVSVTGPDFTVSLAKSSLSTPPGGFDSSTITLTSKSGFSGLVDIAAYPSGGISAFLSPSSVPVPSAGSGSANLTIFVPASTLPGNYSVEFVADSGSLSQALDILVMVAGPGFTVSPNLFLVQVNVGASNTAIITLTPFGGFTGTVVLDGSSSPAGLDASFVPASLNVPGAGSSTLTVTAPTGTSPGYYALLVTASHPTFNATTYVNVEVKAPDISFAASPEEISLIAGGLSCSSTITVTSLNGFTGPVTLTNTTFPTGLIVSISQTMITTSGTATITISAPVAAVPGTYSIDVDANSGSISHFITIMVIVTGPDFSISANPSSFSFTSPATGSVTQTATVSVKSFNGFSGIVSLDASLTGTNMTASISQASLASPGTSLLSVSVGNASISGVYTVIITGTSGSLSHTEFVSVTVTAPDFTISANPTTIQISSGDSGTSIITVGALNGFTGIVDLSIYAPIEVNATVTPTSLTGSATSTLKVNSTIPGTYTVEVDGLSGNLFHPTFISLTVIGPDFSIAASPTTLPILPGSNANSIISITSVQGFSGSVGLTSIAPIGITPSFNTSSTTPTTSAKLTISVAAATPAGTYYVDVEGTSGPLSHTKIIAIQVSDFSITASPAALNLPTGSSRTSTIVIGPVNGFTGQVSVSVSTSTPAGLAGSLNITVVNGAGNIQLTLVEIDILAPGTYKVNVTGVSGELSHVIVVTVSVSDFSVSASPVNPNQLNTGQAGSSTITLAALNGFSGTVDLSVSTSSPVGLSCSLPSSATFGTTPQTKTLNCSAALQGDYDVTVIATTGSLLHGTAPIRFHVVSSSNPNFTITASPASLTIQAGSSATTTITVTSQNGFTSAVALTSTVSPNGPSALFSTDNLSGGSGASTLTITVGDSVAPGTYLVTIYGSGGGLDNAVEVAVTVTASSSSSSILGLPSTTFYGLIALIAIAAVGLGIYFMRFRKK